MTSPPPEIGLNERSLVQEFGTPVAKSSQEAEVSEADAGQTSPPAPFLDMFRFSDNLDKFLMTVGTILAMAYGVIQPLVAIILGDAIQGFINYGMTTEMINRGIIPNDPQVIADAKQKVSDDVIESVILFVVIGAAACFASYLSQACWIFAGERQAHRIREKFLTAILNQDVHYFDDNEVGDLTTRLSVDTSVLQEAISGKVGLSISFITTFFAGFIIAFIKGWRLTLSLMATFPVLGAAGVVVGMSIAAATEGSSAAYAKAGAIVQETLANIRTVSAFNGQKRALAKFDILLADAAVLNEKKVLRMGLGFGVFFGLLFIVYAIAFWAGSLFVTAGQMSGGDVLNVIFAILIGAFGLLGLAPGLQTINKGRGVCKKLYDVIAQKPTIADIPNAAKPVSVSGKVEFRDITFAYPSRPDVVVLKNFSLTVDAGSTCALVGFSGSGKSTTIQLLERFYDLTQGEVLFDGKNIKELDLKWLRQSIGLVSQEPILFDATIAENIRYGAPKSEDITQEQIEKVAKMANAHDFISSLSKGYDTRTGERGSQLSGGQKQRIAIARALLKNPRLLLLDEATSALDTESEAIVQQALDNASKDRTTIVIAHRLSTIKNANKIVVMSEGQVVEVGTHNELLEKKGQYADLVRAQELKTNKDLSNNNLNSTFEATVPGQVAIDLPEVDLKTNDVEAVTEEQRKKQYEETLLKENKTPLWNVLQLQKPEMSYLAIGTVGAIVNGAILPIFGLFFGRVLAVFQEPDPDKLRAGASFWAIIFTILGVLQFFANLFQFAGFGISGERLTRRVRLMSFKALMRQDIAYFDDPFNGTGALTARLSDDAEKIQQLTGVTFGTISSLVVSMAVALGGAFYYSWRMTLTVLAIVPFMVLAGYLEAKTNLNITGSDEVRKSYAKASQTACDAIGNIRTVKSLNIEAQVVVNYMDNISLPYRLGRKKAWVATFGYGFSQGTAFWIYAGAFYAGYRYVFADLLTVTDLFTSLFCIVFGAISFSNAAAFGPDIGRARVSSISFYKLIDRVPPIDIADDNGVKPVDVSGEVDLKELRFHYPQRPDIKILKGISLKVLQGQSVALVGPSGSGKSTIISMLERFYDPVEGSASIEGSKIPEWNLHYLRQQLSIVSQEPTLFIGTIGENVAYGVPNATQEEIEEASKKANIHDFVKNLPDGYKTEISNSQLSGGQKQRISIARSLLCKPKLLLLDEATSALDSESEKVVQEALNAASEGRTTVTIAHRLSTIQNADLIVVMKDGEIAETGKHFDLLEKKGLYYALVQKQGLGANAS